MAISEGSNGSVGAGGSAHRSHSDAGFGERVEHISTGAQQLWGEARSAVEDLNATLDIRGRVRRHPYGMIAAAIGVGYVLGGGLFTSASMRLVRLGFRLAALPAIRAQLLGMAESALGSLETAGSAASESGNFNKPV